ncbi:Bifunctional bis(5'-adenosyl)-triphosphatase/adenylylsulfatase FHIT [Cucumispora dikerogammari]|nr:Bifunctional bis(5'-adenosyl)-triphosphatase/adenylylsulfatase FHIT [Cucumispora dikerogammari]
MKFSTFDIDDSLIIYETDYSFAFLSIHPILKYHTLVCPKRVIQKFKELTAEEVKDFSEAVSYITKTFRSNKIGTGALCNIQDGPAAGQVVAHVHMHILPKKTGDFKEKEIESFSNGTFCEDNIPLIEKNELIIQSQYLKKLFN